MKISIFGLGYVGCVTAACLAHDGHKIIGVEVNHIKVEILRSGRSPITEPNLEEMVEEVVKSGNLKITNDRLVAVQESDIS